MPTKITAIYENPQDSDAFEAGYPEQLTLAKKIPGVKRIESAKVWPKEDGSATPAYRIFDMYFTDYDAASRAVTTEEASAFVSKVFELATGGVRLLFLDVEEVKAQLIERPGQGCAAGCAMALAGSPCQPHLLAFVFTHVRSIHALYKQPCSWYQECHVHEHRNHRYIEPQRLMQNSP